MNKLQVLMVLCLCVTAAKPAAAFDFTAEAGAATSVAVCARGSHDSKSPNDVEIGCFFGVTTTLGIAVGATTGGLIVLALADTRSTNTLIDQAYTGDGEAVRMLAQTTRLSVDEVSDTIVDLNERGKLNPKKRKQTERTIAKALNAKMTKKKKATRAS